MANVFDERIKVLQAQMARDGLKAYVIPATDPHLSEEATSRYTYPRFYFCAFKGSDGTLLVTLDKAYLYTDGRFWVEAEGDLQGTSCELVKAGKPGVPSLTDFVKTHNLYPLGLNGLLFSLRELRSFYVDDLHRIVSLDYSFLVKGLPSLPQGKIWKVDPSLLSTSLKERVSQILAYAKDHQAESVLLTALDDISYVLG
jgi:Xaa-Pro aminopeptidase